jgi:hypothetical protein
MKMMRRHSANKCCYYKTDELEAHSANTGTLKLAELFRHCLENNITHHATAYRDAGELRSVQFTLFCLLHATYAPQKGLSTVVSGESIVPWRLWLNMLHGSKAQTIRKI